MRNNPTNSPATPPSTRNHRTTTRHPSDAGGERYGEGVTDPEDSVDVSRDELVEREADVTDEFDRPLPVEADEADVIEQKRDVPDSDEDDYPA
jgi:hypothetical protein